MQATIIATQQIELSLTINGGGVGCIHRVQRKEFVNTITEVTKLLLKSCNCSNCSVNVSNMGSDWCMHQKEKPENEVCVMWKEQLAPIKDFVKWAEAHTKSKELTKKLLKGASCEYCKFRSLRVRHPNYYCEKKEYCPELDCCEFWEENIFITHLLKIKRFPAKIAPEEILPVQQIQDLNSEIYYIKPNN